MQLKKIATCRICGLQLKNPNDCWSRISHWKEHHSGKGEDAGEIKGKNFMEHLLKEVRASDTSSEQVAADRLRKCFPQIKSESSASLSNAPKDFVTPLLQYMNAQHNVGDDEKAQQPSSSRLQRQFRCKKCRKSCENAYEALLHYQQCYTPNGRILEKSDDIQAGKDTANQPATVIAHETQETDSAQQCSEIVSDDDSDKLTIATEGDLVNSFKDVGTDQPAQVEENVQQLSNLSMEREEQKRKHTTDDKNETGGISAMPRIQLTGNDIHENQQNNQMCETEGNVSPGLSMQPIANTGLFNIPREKLTDQARIPHQQDNNDSKSADMPVNCVTPAHNCAPIDEVDVFPTGHHMKKGLIESVVGVTETSMKSVNGSDCIVVPACNELDKLTPPCQEAQDPNTLIDTSDESSRRKRKRAGDFIDEITTKNNSDDAKTRTHERAGSFEQLLTDLSANLKETDVSPPEKSQQNVIVLNNLCSETFPADLQQKSPESLTLHRENPSATVDCRIGNKDVDLMHQNKCAKTRKVTHKAHLSEHSKVRMKKKKLKKAKTGHSHGAEELTNHFSRPKPPGRPQTQDAHTVSRPQLRTEIVGQKTKPKHLKMQQKNKHEKNVTKTQTVNRNPTCSETNKTMQKSSSENGRVQPKTKRPKKVKNLIKHTNIESGGKFAEKTAAIKKRLPDSALRLQSGFPDSVDEIKTSSPNPLKRSEKKPSKWDGLFWNSTKDPQLNANRAKKAKVTKVAETAPPKKVRKRRQSARKSCSSKKHFLLDSSSTEGLSTEEDCIFVDTIKPIAVAHSANVAWLAPEPVQVDASPDSTASCDPTRRYVHRKVTRESDSTESIEIDEVERELGIRPETAKRSMTARKSTRSRPQAEGSKSLMFTQTNTFECHICGKTLSTQDLDMHWKNECNKGVKRE